MKKIILFAIVTIAITSCSKDSATTTTPTLVGKWSLVNVVEKIGTTTNNYTGKAADYVDFKSNGTIERFIDGEKRTDSYTINGSNLVLISQTYIITLTTTTANLYCKEDVSGSKNETTVNLKK